MASKTIVLLVLTTLITTTDVISARAQTRGPVVIDLAPPPEGVTQELVLKDGTRAYGRVVRVADDVLTFRTASGAAIEVSTADVVALRPVVGEMRHGEFWRADPNATRLFFAPTGRALRKGEGYFGVYEIVLPFVQAGITDRISSGAGTPLIFGAYAEPHVTRPARTLLRWRRAPPSRRRARHEGLGSGHAKRPTHARSCRLLGAGASRGRQSFRRDPSPNRVDAVRARRILSAGLSMSRRPFRGRRARASRPLPNSDLGYEA